MAARTSTKKAATKATKKIDRFSNRTLPTALRERGFRSPYLRTYVVARINPIRFHRAKKGETAPPMPMGAALTRMAASARKFDLEKVRESDLALVAAVSGGD